MLPPTKLILDYFTTNILSLGKNENNFAKQVITAFNIKSSKDIWKIPAYIEYRTDNIMDLTQSFQTMDFTFYTGKGDCEDQARAIKKGLEALNLPTYYWLVFQDESYQVGHAMTIFINEDGYLTAQNYTEQWINKDYTITTKDIENNTERFKYLMEGINGAIFPKQLDWRISWIIKTNSIEYPKGYIKTPISQSLGNIEYSFKLDSRELILPEIESLNLTSNLNISNFSITSTIVLGLLALWLSRK